MKIIEKTNDERLGSAVLYNFTLGYGKPVPMDVYNYVLPFMFHDLFRNKIFESTSFGTLGHNDAGTKEKLAPNTRIVR